MIQLADKQSCTGCCACSNICPKQAISMVGDEEGFRQPSINLDKCIECKLCMKTCPQIQSEFKLNKKPDKCYALYSYKYQRNGSSGGAFSAIADAVLEQGGVVFGAAFDKDLKLRHIGVERKEDMQPLRGSKYVQSYIGDSFKDVRKFLRAGRLVLFSGTPCQIDGLNHFLSNRKYENLITVDVTCHGVPSQKAFDRWINDIQVHNGKVTAFNFRKLDGWSIVPRAKLSNGKFIPLRYGLEVYMWAFYEGFLFRNCCYHCPYASVNRPADITLADFWGVGNYGVKFKPDQTHGISLVLANNEKGQKVISSLKDVYLEPRQLSEALNEQHNLKAPSSRPEGRDNSALDFVSDMSMIDFGSKYHLLPENKIKYLISARMKDYMIDHGIFDVLKNMTNKIKAKL